MQLTFRTLGRARALDEDDSNHRPVSLTAVCAFRPSLHLPTSPSFRFIIFFNIVSRHLLFVFSAVRSTCPCPFIASYSSPRARYLLCKLSKVNDRPRHALCPLFIATIITNIITIIVFYFFLSLSPGPTPLLISLFIFTFFPSCRACHH